MFLENLPKTFLSWNNTPINFWKTSKKTQTVISKQSFGDPSRTTERTPGEFFPGICGQNPNGIPGAHAAILRATPERTLKGILEEKNSWMIFFRESSSKTLV